MTESFRNNHSKERWIHRLSLWLAVAILGLAACSQPIEAKSSLRIQANQQPTPTTMWTNEETLETFPTIIPINTSTPEPNDTPQPSSTPEPSPTFSPTSTPTPEQLLTLGLGGDLMLGRLVNLTSIKSGDFDVLDGITVRGDVNLVNLESPVAENCIQNNDPSNLSFCTDTRFLPALAKENVVVAIANNHRNDFGLGKESLRLLNESKIPYVFSQEESDDYRDVVQNGIKLRFMSFELTNPNWGPNELGSTIDLRREAILKKVRAQTGYFDWLILSIHWGNEYINKPEKWQIEFAHELIDAGVNIIVGTHPHVVSDPLFEDYNNGTIIYSLGNLVFDQDSDKTNSSYWLRIQLSKNKINKIEAYPIKILFPSGQPVLIDQTPVLYPP